MQHSQPEADLLRILKKCEDLASNYSKSNEHRLKSYIQALEDNFSDLLVAEVKTPENKLKEYERKISFIKDFLEIKQKSNEIEYGGSAKDVTNHISLTKNDQNAQNAMSKVEMKKELFSKSTESSHTETTQLRHRNLETKTASQEAEDSVAQQEVVHEQIAQNMMALTRNLKHNSQVASKIIKEDTRVLQESGQQSDKNVAQLKQESARLETHLKKGTNWWIWIALAAVCVTFMCMIVFIRFFPKPR